MRPLFFQFISDLVPEKDIFSHSVFDLFWPIKSTAIQSDCGLDWPVSLPRKALDILMTYLGNPSALSLSVEVEQQWRLRIVSSALTDSTCPQIVSPQVSRSVFLPFFPFPLYAFCPVVLLIIFFTTNNNNQPHIAVEESATILIRHLVKTLPAACCPLKPTLLPIIF
ncbi:hypothetical protein PCANC_03305 [Puccinia coronata f. sp. avenae]|uniref:Uncharacterized protein n=1 Tax=Puccinia coronata f. sp. avenae TaxID=200324 RepID=A0A2N5VYY3_9BASI|nr:hypothetical protein PCASD_07973 [Puccinia coronata f. sp. avenae]PLW55211.1 hypothetical protein PCANC_03305 [Puccinia coronata f. sp. avenae]